MFCVVVVAVYALATHLAELWRYGSHLPPDRMMTLADQVLRGHLDSPTFRGSVDSVAMNGRYYVAVGPLQLVPYLPFAVLGRFQDVAGFVVSGVVGLAAALLAPPLVRAWGARGVDAWLLAAFAAFGTLLFFLSVFGNFYWLAQVQSFAALACFLIEWKGRRRAVVLGACLAVSFLARPTTMLAAIPFGIALAWPTRLDRQSIVGRLPLALAFALPIVGAVALYAWFNWARFGSPFETGYAISYLPQPGLAERRAMGLFSLAQVPENLRLALLTTFQPLDRFPYFTASPYGLSMLLVSPALLLAAFAGWRDRDVRLAWFAAALVAVPVFLYYGGGYIQYGFRYSMDFTPFLIALMAAGSGRWRASGRAVALFLVSASIVSVAYGIAWHAIPGIGA